MANLQQTNQTNRKLFKGKKTTMNIPNDGEAKIITVPAEYAFSIHGRHFMRHKSTTGNWYVVREYSTGAVVECGRRLVELIPMAISLLEEKGAQLLAKALEKKDVINTAIDEVSALAAKEAAKPKHINHIGKYRLSDELTKKYGRTDDIPRVREMIKIANDIVTKEGYKATMEGDMIAVTWDKGRYTIGSKMLSAEIFEELKRAFNCDGCMEFIGEVEEVAMPPAEGKTNDTEAPLPECTALLVLEGYAAQKKEGGVLYHMPPTVEETEDPETLHDICTYIHNNIKGIKVTEGHLTRKEYQTVKSMVCGGSPCHNGGKIYRMYIDGDIFKIGILQDGGIKHATATIYGKNAKRITDLAAKLYRAMLGKHPELDYSPLGGKKSMFQDFIDKWAEDGQTYGMESQSQSDTQKDLPRHCPELGTVFYDGNGRECIVVARDTSSLNTDWIAAQYLDSETIHTEQEVWHMLNGYADMCDIFTVFGYQFANSEYTTLKHSDAIHGQGNGQSVAFTRQGITIELPEDIKDAIYDKEISIPETVADMSEYTERVWPPLEEKGKGIYRGAHIAYIKEHNRCKKIAAELLSIRRLLWHGDTGRASGGGLDNMGILGEAWNDLEFTDKYLYWDIPKLTDAQNGYHKAVRQYLKKIAAKLDALAKANKARRKVKSPVQSKPAKMF